LNPCHFLAINSNKIANPVNKAHAQSDKPTNAVPDFVAIVNLFPPRSQLKNCPFMTVTAYRTWAVSFDANWVFPFKLGHFLGVPEQLD